MKELVTELDAELTRREGGSAEGDDQQRIHSHFRRVLGRHAPDYGGSVDAECVRCARLCPCDDVLDVAWTILPTERLDALDIKVPS